MLVMSSIEPRTSQSAWLKSAQAFRRGIARSESGLPLGSRLQRQFVEHEVPNSGPPRSATRQAGIGQNFQTQSRDALQFGLEHHRV